MIGRALLVAALALAAVAAPAAALNNGLGLTPQMGWNSWNHFACNVSDALLRETAQAMIDTGLAAAGYNYVNVDDCWQISRDEWTGQIIADPTRFPEGMAPLISYIHSLGLKFGLYSDAGEMTCQQRPGSLGYEHIDAQTYAEWGVDYLKYDNCYNPGTKPEIRYPPMRDALNATGREIFFSMCEWGVDQPYNWAPEVGNSWRTTGDINDSWKSMIRNIDQNNDGYQAAGPGAWNDPDMLEIGNGNGQNMSTAESITHFSLWALAKAPLIIGCDVTNMTSETFTILTNTEVIAINQDALGVQGNKQYSENGLEIWAGPVLPTGSFAVVLVNRNDLGSGPASLGFAFQSIGASGNSYDVRDLWAHQDLGSYTVGFPPQSIDPHASLMYKLTPTASKPKVILSEQ